jgi:hypothetical protein
MLVRVIVNSNLSKNSASVGGGEIRKTARGPGYPSVCHYFFMVCSTVYFPNLAEKERKALENG